MSDVLARLDSTIATRMTGDPKSSYVAKLRAGGVPLAARKLGEEAAEAMVASLSGTGGSLAAEGADLLFHLMVLLRLRGLSIADVEAELERREGVSGISERAARKGG